MSLAHGKHNTYSRGCRCQPCRDAHAAYVRAGRQAASQRHRAGHRPANITHGYSGYQNHYCRCEICRTARAEYDQRRMRRRRVEGRPTAVTPRPTKFGRSQCRACLRDVALLSSGFLRAHQVAGRTCDGSWSRATEALAAAA
jgi:hypothetical protein